MIGSNGFSRECGTNGSAKYMADVINKFKMLLQYSSQGTLLQQGLKESRGGGIREGCLDVVGFEGLLDWRSCYIFLLEIEVVVLAKNMWGRVLDDSRGQHLCPPLSPSSHESNGPEP